MRKLLKLIWRTERGLRVRLWGRHNTSDKLYSEPHYYIITARKLQSSQPPPFNLDLIETSQSQLEFRLPFPAADDDGRASHREKDTRKSSTNPNIIFPTLIILLKLFHGRPLSLLFNYSPVLIAKLRNSPDLASPPLPLISDNWTCHFSISVQFPIKLERGRKEVDFRILTSFHLLFPAQSWISI